LIWREIGGHGGWLRRKDAAWEGWRMHLCCGIEAEKGKISMAWVPCGLRNTQTSVVAG